MAEILDPGVLAYFFGPQFSVDTAMETMANCEDSLSLVRDLEGSIATNRAHRGLQLIGYQDVDTGLSLVAMVRDKDALSGISFFAQSNHRLFGGSTLICVPLVFCTSMYRPNGNYLVYRHTYKRPRFNETEIRQKMKSDDPSEKLRAFLFTRSRDGYETIPGMSYVGITRRSWQERYAEHAEKAMEASTSTRFHEAIRTMQGQRVIHVHDISAFGIKEGEAKAIESELISKSTLWPLGLNMKA